MYLSWLRGRRDVSNGVGSRCGECQFIRNYIQHCCRARGDQYPRDGLFERQAVSPALARFCWSYSAFTFSPQIIASGPGICQPMKQRFIFQMSLLLTGRLFDGGEPVHDDLYHWLVRFKGSATEKKSFTILCDIIIRLGLERRETRTLGEVP